MLPYELRKDKDGLLYIDDDNIINHHPLLIDRREFEVERYYTNGFYSIPSTDDYIVKYSYTVFTRKEIKEIKDMLVNLIYMQNKVPDVDFPIAYFRKCKKLAGLIIRYYKNGISCDNIFANHDIEEIGKYYAYDEDNIRNLFLLFNDVLNIINEMFDNGVYYTDINSGNIVIDDNKVKLIDFDPHYVKFNNKDKMLEAIMRTYKDFLKMSLKAYNMNYDFNGEFKSFDHAKTFTKKLENVVRQK